MRLPPSGPHLSGPALAAIVHAAESAATGELVFVAFARAMGIAEMCQTPAEQTSFANLDTIAVTTSQEKP